MSDFFNDPTQHRSRRNRPCIYCGEPINKGDVYTNQTGRYDGEWQTNHYHQECFQDLCDSGDREFCPYSNERPVLEDAP